MAGMDDRRLESLETLFKALADRTRLRILGLLVNGEICVCHIHDSLGIPQPMASRHLAYLRRAGLVATRKDGLWVHYRLADLADPVLESVLSSVAHAVGHAAVTARDRRRLARKVPAAPIDLRPIRGCCVDPRT
jgi:ArsR family transcriptional regulator, arsenate/arsenite/antimonite-responsive transcriptional repressor